MMYPNDETVFPTTRPPLSHLPLSTFKRANELPAYLSCIS